MSRSYQAFIKPDMLLWARVTAQMSIDEVAKKIRVGTERVHSWESGESLPTVKQLRKLSKIYNQSFAAFYLPHPPKSDIPIPNDYRRLSGTTIVTLSPELALDIRTAWERRGIILDLFAERGESPKEFIASTGLDSDPERLGLEIRELLGISYEMQKEWREHRIAFNQIREALESVGVLIFQAAKIPLNEIRGYSLSQPVLPIITINRKDSYSGRIFTMLHELTHIMLRTGGLCDMTTLGDIPPEASKIEIFCNHAAGSTLVPQDRLLDEPIVQSRGFSTEWTEQEIATLAKTYCTSREVIIRRFQILGLTTQKFYELKRKQYLRELRLLSKRRGFVSPPVDIVSTAGKFYVRTIMDAFHSDLITPSDAIDYLGIRLKHLDRVTDLLESYGLEG